MNTTLDLDDLRTWPHDLVTLLRRHKDTLLSEREAQEAYDLSPSTYRIANKSPYRPAWDEVTAFVKANSSSWRLRVFHATRLLDTIQVQAEGLRRLHLDEQLKYVQTALRTAGSREDIVSALEIPEDTMFLVRENAVWFTPMRRWLHDGGCNVFFEHFGGEAIERIAGIAGEEALLAIRSLGIPAVVVATIPATGWCRFADGRLPQTIIEVFLEAEAGRRAVDYGWDVMVERDIPPDCIETIVAPTDSLVSA